MQSFANFSSALAAPKAGSKPAAAFQLEARTLDYSKEALSTSVDARQEVKDPPILILLLFRNVDLS